MAASIIITDLGTSVHFQFPKSGYGLPKDTIEYYFAPNKDGGTVKVYSNQNNKRTWLFKMLLSDFDGGFSDFASLQEHLLQIQRNNVKLPYEYFAAEQLSSDNEGRTGCFADNAMTAALEEQWAQIGETPYRPTAEKTIAISSSSGADVGWPVLVAGFNQAGLLINEVAVINGQAKVVLSNKMIRVQQLIRVSAGPPMVGEIYCYEDGAVAGGIPTDLTTIFNKIGNGKNQSISSFISGTGGRDCFISGFSIDSDLDDLITWEFQNNDILNPSQWIVYAKGIVSGKKGDYKFPVPILVPKMVDGRFVAQGSVGQLIKMTISFVLRETN